MIEGMEEKFIRACEEHSDALFRYCYFKIRDREIAKDLVQETFMRTWNYMQKGVEIENLRAFFYRTLGNAIIDEYRKKKPISLDWLAEEGFDPGEDYRKSIADKLDGERAMALLNQIPPKYKD